MQEFIREDDLKTFEGWLRYQGIDAATTPEELETWRGFERAKTEDWSGFQEIHRGSGDLAAGGWAKAQYSARAQAILKPGSIHRDALAQAIRAEGPFGALRGLAASVRRPTRRKRWKSRTLALQPSALMRRDSLRWRH